MGLARSRSTNILAFAALLCGVGVGAALLDARFADGRQVATQHVPLLVLIAAFAATEAFVVHIEVRDNAHSFTLNELPLVVGLFFAAPRELLIARLVGGLAVVAWANRDAWIKAVFNAGLFTAEVSLVLLAFHRFSVFFGPTWTPGRWLATFASLLLVNWLSAIAIVGVISLSGGTTAWASVRNMIGLGSITSIATTSLGLLTVVVVLHEVAALMLVVVVAAVLFISYQAYAELRQRYASLQQLHEFTRVLAASPELTTTIRRTLEQAREVLRAEVAELCLVHRNEVWADIRLRLGTDGELQTEHSQDLAQKDDLVAAIIESRLPVLVPEHSRDDTQQAFLTGRDARDLVACPLIMGDEVIGTITVMNRLGDVSTFGVEDLRVFETLTNHAAVSLENVRLIDQLRVEAADKEHQALHDALTGLGNRVLFQRRTDEALIDRRGDRSRLAVMLLDMNRFKDVNDTLGHHNGDVLLRQVANRVLTALPSDATVTRLGGDEFAVLLPHIARTDDAIDAAQDLQSVLAPAFHVGGLDLGVGAAIGIAVYPDHGEDTGSLLQHADIAMYAAKDARDGGVQVFSAAFAHEGTRRLRLAADLRIALEGGMLAVYYQPVASVRTGQVVGAEALLRWEHPEHGWVPPDEVIPLAEHLGLIRPLTQFVLDSALRQCRAWDDAGLSIPVAVNLSAQSLVDRSLPGAVARALQQADVRPDQLVLEITETHVIAEPEVTLEVLQELHGLGVSLAIDDFGTGYSSLAYLARLPVDEIKIDKSFVLAMLGDDSARTIVRSVIELARNLGHTVIAEGVEDQMTWDALDELGCDLAQGYYLSRPTTAQKLTPWLLARGPGRLRMVETLPATAT